MTKSKLLTGACALVAASMAMTGGANAAVVNTFYGGGSSLIAPYINQATNCYGTPTSLVLQGSVHSGAGANDTLGGLSPFVYKGTTPPTNCATTQVAPTAQFFYMSTGSGTGINGYFSHDAQNMWGDATPGTDPSFWPAVSYASSDASLGPSDLAVYNNGGTESTFTYGAPGSQGTATYPNPAGAYGSMIQIPLSVDPVALVYSPVYKKVADAGGTVTQYSFHLHHANADGSGGLVLDMPTACAIFNGKITNWNDPALKALNGNVSLQAVGDPAGAAAWATTGLPIELVGRSDSSGTTSIFYRALAAQCNGTYSGGTYTNNFLPAGSKTLPTSLQGPLYTTGTDNESVTPVPGTFTRAALSSGVATYIDFSDVPAAGQTLTQGRLGYVGTDYVLPAAVANTGNNYGLNLVDIKTPGGSIYGVEPTPANVLRAFGTGVNALVPPESTYLGNYSQIPFGSGTSTTQIAAHSYGHRNTPTDWAEPISTTWNTSDPATGSPVTINTPLADPNGFFGITTAYPIVGTTVGLFYTCYANESQATAMKKFIAWYSTALLINQPTEGLIVSDGLQVLPVPWKTAINRTYATPIISTTSIHTAQLNLYIRAAGDKQVTVGTDAPYGGQCHTVTPGA